MNRKQFLENSLKLGAGCCVACFSGATVAPAAPAADTSAPAGPPPAPAVPSALQREKDFTDGWLTDLLDTISQECDEATQIRLIEGCGRGCYRRHKFKQDIAEKAGGTVEGLLAACRGVFEAWDEGGNIHLRFGEVSTHCYCVVLKDRRVGPADIHCHCTKATLGAVVENALHRPVRMEIVETVRRGGRTCHFIARLG